MKNIYSFNVNGVDSSINLADSSNNGLMSSESYNSILILSSEISKKVPTTNDSLTTISDNSSTFNIVDYYGNNALRIDNNGVMASKFIICSVDGSILKIIDENINNEIMTKITDLTLKIDDFQASDINFDNTNGLISDNVQDCIEELNVNIEILDTSIQQHIETIKQKTDSFIIDDNDDSFNVTDKNGNIISKISDSGLFDININPLLNNSLYIIDKNGNVVTKINDNGIQSVKYLDEEGQDLKEYIDTHIGTGAYSNYELFSIGDSLSSSNQWNTICADYLGCTFNATANTYPGAQISTGGTRTDNGNGSSGYFRTMHLVNQNLITDNGENAIIILENINDMNGVTILEDGSWKVSGTKEDTTVFPTVPINDYITSSEFTSDYLISIIDKFAPGAFCSVHNIVSGKSLTIDTLPTSEGDVTIRTGWTGSGTLTYTIHVIPQTTDDETLSYIIERILEYDYTSVTAAAGDNANEVTFTTGNSTYPASLYFDGGTTGMTATITDTSNAKVSYNKIFTGESEEEWIDTSNWISTSSYMNMWRSWKSSIEYLIDTYPKAHIFITSFPNHMTESSTYMSSNGTYDYVSYNNTDRQIKNAALIEFHQQLADMYHIPHINVHNECGINLGNYSTYYYDNNVHPKTVGYEKIGKFVAKQIMQNIY